MSEVEADEDVALLLGATPDADRLAVLRKRGAHVEAALLQAAVEGQPLHGDLLRLAPRDGQPLVFDIQTLYEAPRPERRAEGPAQVATPAFREGWARTFGPPPDPADAPS